MAEGVKVLKANNQFSNELYKHVASPGENLVFSPLSAHACLSMAYQGADGTTKQAFADGLKVGDPAAAAEGYHVIMSNMNSAERVTLHIANKAYVMQKYRLKDEFRDVVLKKFLSEVQSLDFANSAAAAAAVNGWVNAKTQGKIPTLFDASSFDQYTRLVLVNAIYFKGEWQHQFSKEGTRTEPFYLDNERKVDCQMMHTKKKFNYKEDEELDAKILEMKYTNNFFSMLLILPNKKDGLAELEGKLANVDLDKITEGMYCPDVIVAVPKFKIEQTINLTEVLPKMGFAEIFDENKCNLSKMIEGDEPLVVSKVIQKAFIEVNEEGAEAAAATGLIAVFKCATHDPVVFQADHPFLYIINISDEQRMVVFMGKIESP